MQLTMQGSILGSTLWNILYDRVLRVVQVEGIKVAFADGLAGAATAKIEVSQMIKTNRALQDI